MHSENRRQLALMQQSITVGCLFVALLWAWLCWKTGHRAWGWAAAASIAGSYAAVLGLEFMLLRAVHRDDAAPRATCRQLLRAWWGEVQMGPRVFCWRQPFRSMQWPDQLPAQARGRRGVLLIHGFVCNRGIWNPWLRRLTAQGVPFIAINLQPVFGAIDDDLACIDAAASRLATCTGLAPVIVAHSMGGLVARRWWVTVPKAVTPVHHIVTIGTPHQGTWLARFGRSRNTRQMRPGSRWLETLKAAEPTGRYQRFTCFYSHCDNIVFPASLATLDGADNRHLPGIAHVRMVDAREPWDEVQRLLLAPVSQPPGMTPAPVSLPEPRLQR